MTTYRDSLERIFTSAVINYVGNEIRTAPKKYAYQDAKPESYFTAEIEKANENQYYVSVYTGLNEELFSAFARDVISRGTKFIVLSGPTHPLIKKTYKATVIDTAFDGFFREQALKLGFAYLPQSELPLFTEDDFIDFTHLNAAGRGKLTEFLKDYLARNALVQSPVSSQP